MQLLSFTIAAGETKVYEIAGRYLEVIDSTASVDIYLSDTAGGRTDDARGALSGLYMEGAFARFEIYSATAQDIELLITDGRGGSRRQPGNVRVIDQAADKTSAGLQHIGSVRLAGNAAYVSIVGLLCVRRLAIKRLVVNCAVSEIIFIGSGTAAPGAYIAVPTGVPNKKLGGADSSSGVFTTSFVISTPTAPEAPGYRNIVRAYATAFVPSEIPLTTPIVMEPGQVIYVNGATLNREVSAIFDIEEL